MDSFLFGPPDRRLFASLHTGPHVGPAAGLGVLLCAPWGQEAIRTQRMFRVLAERLTRSGATVLRFDYFGTGDSAGDDLDVTLTGCCQDICAAHAHLLGTGAVRKVVWVGVRLGASCALMATKQQGVPQPPAHLIMWEPVVDGRGYLEVLRAKHVEALRDSYTRTDPGWSHSLMNDPHAFTDEAIGFSMSDVFRDQIGALQLQELRPTGLNRVTILAPAAHEEAASLSNSLNTSTSRNDAIAFDHDFDWTSEEALNTALVPGPAVQKLNDLCIDT